MEFGTLLAGPEGGGPAGIELRNEPAFHAIERLLQPAARSERLNPDGSPNESASQVDWQDVWDQVQDLASLGRDLRLIVIATRGYLALSRSGEAGGHAIHGGFNYALTTADGGSLIDATHG